ncbi:uncharacterized protein LOC129269817 [Lytechinus pictus]|uniref:uncharacterized protein LOC129269817 n=1 Tax=Lytechinus pictus TaxID=7653 RepID=UPI0030B9ED00
MMDAKRKLCLFIFITSYIGYAKSSLYMAYSGNTAEVSLGTRAVFECSSSSQISQDKLRSGRIEWGRNTRYSVSAQVIARWTNENGIEILVDNPDDRYNIEGGILSNGRFRQYLTIQKVQRIDQTDNTGYYCALFNSSASMLVKSGYAPLTVKYPPAEHYPLCTATPNDITREVTLVCTSEKTTPDVTVQWYKDGQKVSDAHPTGYKMKSTYEALEDEFRSEFECRLHYVDGIDVEVRRSCTFSKPRVAILRIGGESPNEESTYHAFAVSNPPLTSDINCTLEESSDTSQRFDKEFPGYGVAAVGPVAPTDNGSTLVCQAKNVFGTEDARMTVYSPSDNQDGETTISSVVTSYMPGGQVLQATIWPTEQEIIPGENATFVCSYSLTIHSHVPAKVEIKWEHDDTVTTETEDNILFITNADYEDFTETSVTCIASVITDDPMINTVPERSSATVRIGKASPCDPKLLSSSSTQGQSHTNMKPYYIAGIFVLAGLVLILIIALMFVMVRKQKHQKKSRSDWEQSSRSQVTYRADSVSSGERPDNRIVRQSSIQRALPAEPNQPAPTTTLRSVVTSPSPATLIINDSGRHRLESISSCTTCNTTTTDLPYQEMVGDTGINKSRHGSVSSNVNFKRHVPLIRSHSVSATMIPVPNGGFLPSTANDHPGFQRTVSEGAGEDCYEDPDAIRERRRANRAPSNDYQSTDNGSSIMSMTMQNKQLASQYANSSLTDDSVFLV